MKCSCEYFMNIYSRYFSQPGFMTNNPILKVFVEISNYSVTEDSRFVKLEQPL